MEEYTLTYASGSLEMTRTYRGAVQKKTFKPVECWYDENYLQQVNVRSSTGQVVSIDHSEVDSGTYADVDALYDFINTSVKDALTI